MNGLSDTEIAEGVHCMFTCSDIAADLREMNLAVLEQTVAFADSPEATPHLVQTTDLSTDLISRKRDELKMLLFFAQEFQRAFPPT